MSNRSAIRDYVRIQTLVEVDDLSNDKINAMLDRGYREIAGRYPWPWLTTSTTISTVADQQGYAMPSDWARTEAIVRAGKRTRLVEVSMNEAFERYGGSFPSAGDAVIFYLWGDTLYFSPIPTQTEADAYTHYYYASPTVMANDTDEPQWVEQFHMILADYAIAEVWRREEDFAKASESQKRFDLALEAMAQFYLNRASDVPSTYGQQSWDWPSRGRNRNMPFLDGA